MMLDFILKSML